MRFCLWLPKEMWISILKNFINFLIFTIFLELKILKFCRLRQNNKCDTFDFFLNNYKFKLLMQYQILWKVFVSLSISLFFLFCIFFSLFILLFVHFLLLLLRYYFSWPLFCFYFYYFWQQSLLSVFHHTLLYCL